MKNLNRLLSDSLTGCASLLDVGCGRNTSLRNVTGLFRRVGLDIYWPYLEKSASGGLHGAYVMADAMRLPFAAGSFDCVAAIEVIEHLPKEMGYDMIREMERVSCGKVILTTPNGFYQASPGPDDNPDERHLSGWSAGDFRRLGYEVYGVSGSRFFRGKNGVMKALPEAAYNNLRESLAIAAYHIPQTAFQLFCVKSVAKR